MEMVKIVRDKKLGVCGIVETWLRDSDVHIVGMNGLVLIEKVKEVLASVALFRVNCGQENWILGMNLSCGSRLKFLNVGSWAVCTFLQL